MEITIIFNDWHKISIIFYTRSFNLSAAFYFLIYRFRSLVFLKTVVRKENIMKTTFLHSKTLPMSAFALIASISVAAANERDGVGNETYTEKKTASEFWADFEQDSEQTWQDSKSAFKDGWIESKLETALILNKHLNPFKINIRVDNSMATLEGDVYSDIDKELAENIALGVEGIDSVSNKINIIEKPAKIAESTAPQGRNFAQYVEDVSTTAAIKTELLASKNIDGLNIDVDTLNDKVTLSGKVKSLEQKALAQAIAAKHDDVKGVVNNLQVKSWSNPKQYVGGISCPFFTYKPKQ